MRSVLLLVVLLTSQLYCQNLKNPILAAYFQPRFAFSSFNNLQFTYPNLTFKTHSRPYSLNVYNPISGLNDSFYLKHNEAKYSKSFYIPENRMNFSGTKIDSFNPYGTNNIGAAVTLGVIDLLLNK